jgi:hypothetical protein
MEAKVGKKPNWRPWRFQAHGEHHRIFTPEKERAIPDQVIDSCIIPGLLCTDATFVEVGVRPFLEKYQDSEPTAGFQYFPGFISDLNRRN